MPTAVAPMADVPLPKRIPFAANVPAPVPPWATVTLVAEERKLLTTLLTLKPVGKFTVPVPSPVNARSVLASTAVTLLALIVDINYAPGFVGHVGLLGSSVFAGRSRRAWR